MQYTARNAYDCTHVPIKQIQSMLHKHISKIVSGRLVAVSYQWRTCCTVDSTYVMCLVMLNSIAHPGVEHKDSAHEEASCKARDVSKVVHEGNQAQQGKHGCDKHQKRECQPLLPVTAPVKQLVSPYATCAASAWSVHALCHAHKC